jgi:hypothetical protein
MVRISHCKEGKSMLLNFHQATLSPTYPPWKCSLISLTLLYLGQYWCFSIKLRQTLLSVIAQQSFSTCRRPLSSFTMFHVIKIVAQSKNQSSRPEVVIQWQCKIILWHLHMMWYSWTNGHAFLGRVWIPDKCKCSLKGALVHLGKAPIQGRNLLLYFQSTHQSTVPCRWVSCSDLVDPYQYILWPAGLIQISYKT